MCREQYQERLEAEGKNHTIAKHNQCLLLEAVPKVTHPQLQTNSLSCIFTINAVSDAM